MFIVQFIGIQYRSWPAFSKRKHSCWLIIISNPGVYIFVVVISIQQISAGHLFCKCCALCIEIYISDRSCYRVLASEWFTMSYGIESVDVVILIHQYLKEINLSRTLTVLQVCGADFWFTHNLLPQEETSISLNKVDSQEAFTACGAPWPPPCPRQRGRWGVDSALGRTTGACFPGKEKSSFLKN